MSFQNARFNEENSIKLARLFIQWRRGDLTNKDERLKRGCWQFMADQWQPIIGNKMDIVQCVHAGGEVKPSYLFGMLHIAVLSYQKLWTVEEGGEVRYLGKGEYQAGARGKFRIFGLVKELLELGYDQPVILTTSGLNSKSMGDGVLVHRNSVVATASKIAKAAFPMYTFWLPVGAGEKQVTRNNQYVTPPEPKLGTITQELLETLFVGQDVIDLAEQYFAEAQEWAKPPQPVAGDNGSQGQPDELEDPFPPTNGSGGQIVEEVI